METFTASLEAPPGGSHRFHRADLIFYGVDHSGPSYTARVFFDAPEADAATQPVEEQGYVGCFTVFGHAGCVGDDDDHCNPRARTVDEFDHRMPHPLVPQTKSVTVTRALQRRQRTGPVVVTVVAVRPSGSGDGVEASDLLAFERLRLATYEHDQDSAEDEEVEAES